MQAKYGELIFDAYLPPAGTPTQTIDKGYKANAWIHIRHPDYDELRGICTEIAETVKVVAA